MVRNGIFKQRQLSTSYLACKNEAACGEESGEESRKKQRNGPVWALFSAAKDAATI